MITRGSFVISAGAAVAASVTPKPLPTTTPGAVPSPKTSATPFPWDLCDQNPVLPYDRPLGLRMRVLDGPDFDLMKYRGYGLIVNVFATWCEPCRWEMPTLVDASSRYFARGLRIVGINFAESDDTVRAFRKKYSIPFPIAMDEHGAFSYSLEHGNSQVATSFPVLLFIGPGGYLYCYKRGSSQRPSDELMYRIEQFLKDEPPTALSSPSPAPN